MLLQPRWAIQAGRRAKASVFSEALMMRAQSGASPYRLRGYSTEASAVREVDAEADNSATKFEELLDRGVHPNLISAITKGMGFETMSSVQAKTINPALKGTDMSVIPFTDSRLLANQNVVLRKPRQARERLLPSYFLCCSG